MVGKRRSWSLHVCLALFLSVCLSDPAAPAQTRANPNLTTQIDGYGNVRPRGSSPRPIDVYQNKVQRQIMRGYRQSGWRTASRPTVAPFSTVSITAARRPAGSRSEFVNPYLPAGSPLQRQSTATGYGGFGRRTLTSGSLIDAVVRRPALIAATSLNAPVHRALLRTGTSPASGRPLQQVPEHALAAGGVSLDDRLRAGANLAFERARAGGWALFRDGDYRLAARSFETATLLEPANAESRIGEFFSYLSVGAVRTAAVVMRELIRRDPNPFLHELNLTTAYGDVAEARRIRIQTQWQASAAEEDPDRRALHAIVLWYLGERDEALMNATMLIREIPRSDYADWPAQMRRALSAATNKQDRSNP